MVTWRPPLWTEWLMNGYLWKHYFPTTSFAGANKCLRDTCLEGSSYLGKISKSRYLLLGLTFEWTLSVVKFITLDQGFGSLFHPGATGLNGKCHLIGNIVPGPWFWARREQGLDEQPSTWRHLLGLPCAAGWHHHLRVQKERYYHYVALSYFVSGIWGIKWSSASNTDGKLHWKLHKFDVLMPHSFDVVCFERHTNCQKIGWFFG